MSLSKRAYTPDMCFYPEHLFKNVLTYISLIYINRIYYLPALDTLTFKGKPSMIQVTVTQNIINGCTISEL